MDLVGLAHDLAGLTVPILALFAFTLPLLAKLFGEKRFPAIYALIAMIFAALSSTIVFIGTRVYGKPLFYKFGGWPPPIGIVYEVDGFNAILALFTAWIMLLISIYSIWYQKHFDEPEWYYILLIGLNAGMLGCLYTGDVFNLFVMLEVLGISAYALVAYHKNKHEALEASMKYAIIGATATTIYFIGLVVIYAVYGTLNMADLTVKNYYLYQAQRSGVALLSNTIAAVGASSLLAVSLALWVFTYKSALFPNHFWLPDAHPEAPTPVSAALSGLVVNIGVYATVRFLYTIFGPLSPLEVYYREIVLLILLVLGFLGGLVGALLMIAQKDIKRLLAYSTVSHIGLIYMAASIGFMTNKPEAVILGLTAMLYHIINHGLGKALLFMASGVFIDAAGTRNMDEMRGVGRLYPITSLAFILGFLSMMGLIPFAGFFSKLLMYQAFMEADLLLPALAIIVISAISVLGYAKAMYAIVFSSMNKEYEKISLKGINYMLLLMALALIVLGVTYPYIKDILYGIVSQYLTPNRIMYYRFLMR
ncbi:MAG: cation:proton antiporter [Staphylothermus sp.]|nr:cation:proton antiporter [Staphylothermus sp.]